LLGRLRLSRSTKEREDETARQENSAKQRHVRISLRYISRNARFVKNNLTDADAKAPRPRPKQLRRALGWACRAGGGDKMPALALAS
jgi:hypothetical protein